MMAVHVFQWTLALLSLTAAVRAVDLPAPFDLQVNHLANPVAISTPQPLLSWKLDLTNATRGTTQEAYQVIVTHTDSGSIAWDTGKVTTAGVRQVKYNGEVLKLFDEYSWTVQWWAHNQVSAVSQPSSFILGPETEADWQNATLLGGSNHTQLRCDFTLSQEDIKRAVAFVLAPGCHVLEVNGAPVGDSFGQCPWLQYDKRMLYQSVDVTTALSNGSNALGVLLGRGFYLRSKFNTEAVLKLLLVVTYSNGTRQTVTSNTESDKFAGRWLQRPSFIVDTDVFLGNTVDLRNYESGWSTTTFEPSSAWKAVQKATSLSDNIAVHAMNMQTSVTSSDISAVNMTLLPNGDAVFDFGANIVGSTMFNDVLPEGAIMTLSHGESLNEDGSVNNTYLTGTLQVDTYIGGQQHPSTIRGVFSWHGFQYVQLSMKNWPAFTPAQDLLLAFKVNADIKQTAHLTHEDATTVAASSAVADLPDGAFLNKFNEIVVRTHLNNLAAALPTDCPTREKHGWLGDAQDTGESAMLTYDAVAILEQFLRTIVDARHPNSTDVPGAVPSGPSSHLTDNNKAAADISWTAAFPLITYWLYWYHNDQAIVEEVYPYLVDYMTNLDHLRVQAVGQLADFYTWGDWCAFGPRDIVTPTTGAPLAAFNWLMSVDTMVELSQLVGNVTGAKYYQDVGQSMRKVYHERFYNASVGMYNANYSFNAQTLTSGVFRLGNVIPESLESHVWDSYLAQLDDYDGHLTFGSGGANYVMDQLSAHGHHDRALAMMTKKDYPSFGYWLSQGATSCWENWSGKADDSHPPIPTHGHIFLCAGALLHQYSHIVGLRPLAPGFARFQVAPQVLPDQGPSGTVFSLRSHYGDINITWAISKSTNGFAISVAVPIDTQAEVTVPFLSLSPSKIRIFETGVAVWENGQEQTLPLGVVSAKAKSDGIVFVVESGLYSFTTTE
eukprot:TRINITY_DN12476_c0_g2_i7.p1 TRINITY_DN12476_c0_g2~~TRINITY_DN12476_c0_g2_i7.p1  ORF type:complete len:946 (+),score=206.96 TRINITY_DN12476_c0_g2_i7:296-3133(+)